MKRLLIIAGGTGGHIFPALVIARALRERGIETHWLGTRGGLEQQLVPNDIPISFISIKALRGKGWLRKITMPFRLLYAVWQAVLVIRQLRPDVVLGMGGYVSGPGAIAAWISRVPLVIHEQNSIAGLTNRFLAKMAKSVLQGFPNTFPHQPNVITTGNPVRKELISVPIPEERLAERLGPLRILVLGGSQGARPLNERMLSALNDYPKKNEIIVWHQTGQADYERVKAAYEKIPIESKVAPFIQDMASAYAWADLIICRAGALTVSEIAAVGVASVFVPYPFAVDNHQFHNSRQLEQAGAAVIVTEDLLTKERLIELFQQFSHDRNRLLEMAISARQFSQPKAADHVIAECEKISSEYGSEHDIG